MVNKSQYLKLSLLSLLVFLLAGCACIPGGISASSTPLNNKPYHILGHTSATDSRFLLLGIIPLTGSNSTKDALNKAIKKAGADALINVTVDGYNQWFIILSRVVTKVEGTGIRFEHYKQEPENIGVKSKKQKTDPEKTGMWDKIKID